MMTGTSNLLIQGRSVPISFECIFYALGWGQPESRQLKCTVVGYNLLDPAVRREITEALEEKNCHINEVERYLVNHNIPQSSSAILEVGAMNLDVHVYFTTTKVTDPAVCPNAFWRAEFGWKFCNDGEDTEIQDGKWDENGD